MKKEQIEGIGFKYNKDSERYELFKPCAVNPKYYYLYHRPGSFIHKSIVTIYEGGTSASDTLVNRIQINNIFELGILLQRLGIID